MDSTPCPSDYRRGDESNSSSPYYDEPDPSHGSESVAFAWTFFFDPPHPKLGEEVGAILRGHLAYSDTFEPLSARARRSLARSGGECDGPEPTREYEAFTLESAELPDGRRLAPSELEAEPGFGSCKIQIDGYKPEIMESAQDSLDKPLKAYRAMIAQREQWRQERSPSIILDLGAAPPPRPKP